MINCIELFAAGSHIGTVSLQIEVEIGGFWEAACI